MSDKLIRNGSILKASVLAPIIRRRATEAHKTLAYRMALKLAGDLRSQIYQQGIDMAPLSPRYLRRKIRLGLDDRILIATGTYVNNIRVRKDERGRYVVSPGSRTEVNGVPLDTLASWLEFGTRNDDGSVRMPARPHWRPVWNNFLEKQPEWRKEIVKKVSPELAREIRKAIREASNSREEKRK